jgi:hypothetical protein
LPLRWETLGIYKLSGLWELVDNNNDLIAAP